MFLFLAVVVLIEVDAATLLVYSIYYYYTTTTFLQFNLFRKNRRKQERSYLRSTTRAQSARERSPMAKKIL